MNIKLVRLTPQYREQLFEMLTEWKADIENNRTNPSPYAIFRNDFHDFDYYLQNLEIKEGNADGYVPDTTLFCLDKDRNIFVGAVNIRHYLNETLLKTGGHIGDGIRPSERRKGYATAMISLALQECRKLGISRVAGPSLWWMPSSATAACLKTKLSRMGFPCKGIGLSFDVLK